MKLYEFVESILPNLSTVWESLYSYLTSSLGAVIIGTFVASFAGVVGAHSLTEKFKRRDQYLRELRSANAAIMTTFEIINSMLGLKKQYVRELRNLYLNTKQEFEAFEARRAANQLPDGAIFQFNTDFKTLNPMLMPSEILIKQIHGNLFPPPRAYVLTSTLIRSIDSLNMSISHRNELIQHWKALPQPRSQAEQDAHQSDTVRFYFGLANRAGHVDTSYPDLIDAISALTDDRIQFSYMLNKDLVEHGQSLRKKLGRKSPKVNVMNFDEAKEQGLMPDPADYEDWDSMFKKHPQKTWRRAIQQILRRVNGIVRPNRLDAGKGDP
jgi:hypothetical protein